MAGRRRDFEAVLGELAGSKATVNVHVKLTGGPDEPGGGNRRTRRGGGAVPQAERQLQALRRDEGKLFDWIEADPSRAAEFLADPLSALRQSGVSVDAATARTVSASTRGMKLPGGVRLGKLTAEVDRRTR